MKKAKRQSMAINYIGLIIGAIHLLVAIYPAPTKDPNTPLFLGMIGLVFIILSMTPLGETRLRKWYMIPFFTIPSLLDYIAPKKGFWILLIYGLVAIAAIGTLLIFAPELIQSWLRKN